MRLSVGEYLFRLRALGEGRWPDALGPALRGGFGKALKDSVCPLDRPQCGGCPRKSDCSYGYLFDTPVPEDSEVLRRYPNAPHPFVFHVCVCGPRPNSSRTTVGLSLIEGANAHLAPVLGALVRLGSYGVGPERTRFRVESLESPQGAFWSHGDPPPVAPAPMDLHAEPDRDPPAVLRVRTRTPIRLQTGGAVARSLGARELLSGALRRLELLCRVHGGPGSWDLDASALVREADGATVLAHEERWVDLDRFSRRQGQRMPLGGVMGDWTLTGGVTRFASLLDLAGRLHIGKATAFGLGEYHCEAD